jgi:hypothetical protein
MPLKLIAPIEKDFVLERTDLAYDNEGGPTKITIRQATQAQKERRSLIHSEVTQIVNQRSALSQELRLQQSWSIEELKRIEVQLSLIGSNILDIDGNQLFRFKSNNGHTELDMTDNQFKVAWGSLPDDVADEIHEKVLEVNLSWAGPLGSTN